jgi:hypothetical protein
MVTLHVPKFVYYNEQADNFYDARDHRGMGEEFYSRWFKFREYFARSAVAVMRRDDEKSTPHNQEPK